MNGDASHLWQTPHSLWQATLVGRGGTLLSPNVLSGFYQQREASNVLQWPNPSEVEHWAHSGYENTGFGDAPQRLTCG